MFRWVAFASFVLLQSASSRAAELRITFDELTKLVQSIADTTKIHLNSVPGGLFTSGGLFASGSYIEIGSKRYDLPKLEKQFDKAGSKYGYYVKDMSSTTVRVSAVEGALRLTAVMESDGPEAVPACVSGECPLLNFLPDIEWTRPSVSLDFVPVQFNGSVSLKVKNVVIGGTPQPVCRPSPDFWARAACNIGRAFANQSISKLRTELPKTLKEAINQTDIQQKLSEGLKGYLVVGQAGAVAINAISIAPSRMIVNFRFNTAASVGN
jgi:hypothetical protein